MANSLLEKISEEISPDLPGVDWAVLEQELGMPREEVVYHTDTNLPPDQVGLFKYQRYMQAAFDRMEAALADVVLTFNVQENPATAKSEVAIAMDAWKSVQTDVLTVGDGVLAALRNNAQFLSDDSALVMEREKYRAIISSTYLVCLYGMVVHAKAMMQFADVAPEDIIASADTITQTANGIAMLADMGLLDSLKRTPVVSPTGAIPVAIVIAVVATIGVGIIAWCIVAMTKQIEVNRSMRLICEDAVSRGDATQMERCQELLKINSVALDANPLASTAKSLGQAALMIGIGYALILLVPPVAKMLSARNSRKAAAT